MSTATFMLIGIAVLVATEVWYCAGKHRQSRGYQPVPPPKGERIDPIPPRCPTGVKSAIREPIRLCAKCGGLIGKPQDQGTRNNANWRD